MRIVAVILAVVAVSAACFAAPPDQAAVLHIGTNYLLKTYGKPDVARQQPFAAVLDQGRWFVVGTQDEASMSGPFIVEISPTDGEVLTSYFAVTRADIEEVIERQYAGTGKTPAPVIAAPYTFAKGEMYTQTASGLLHGPYRFKLGEEIRGGTIVIPSERKLEFLNRLHMTIIPSIDFRQAEVRDAIAFIQTASRKHSPAALPPGEIQIDLDLTGYIPPLGDDHDPFAPLPEDLGPPPPVTFSARYISVREALQIVAEITNLGCNFGEDKVSMMPLNKRRIVQQDESTVPSKAAPSASSDVR